MLRVLQTSTREAVCLDGLWDFAVDWNNDGVERGIYQEAFSGHRQAPVPASVNDIFADEAIRDQSVSGGTSAPSEFPAVGLKIASSFALAPQPTTLRCSSMTTR